MSHWEKCVEEIKVSYAVGIGCLLSPLIAPVISYHVIARDIAANDLNMAGCIAGIGFFSASVVVSAFAVPVGAYIVGTTTASIPIRLTYSYIKDSLLAEEPGEEPTPELPRVQSYRPSVSDHSESGFEVVEKKSSSSENLPSFLARRAVDARRGNLRRH